MRFYGQWQPPVDQVIYEHYFKDKQGGFFIEAGAADGLTECSCKFFEESLGWSGINIEPDPFLYNRLCINRPNTININCGLSDTENDVQFTKAIHPSLGEAFGNGSILHQPAHYASLVADGCTFRQFVIHTMTYAQVIEKYNVKHVDLMVLDVEGHELAVLRGMVGSVLPSVLCIEHGNLGNELRSAVTQFGYVFDFKQNNNSYYKMRI